MRVAKILCLVISCHAAHGVVIMGGVGGGYYAAYRANDQALVFPFAPGLSIQLAVGLEGKDVGINTRWRAGIGGTLNPLSSVATGGLALYAISFPLWIEYPVIRQGFFFFYGGFSLGPGLGIYHDNIRSQSQNIVLGKITFSGKAELRIFYPSTLWIEFRPGLFTEFTTQGMAKTMLPGGEIYLGFSNEY